MKYLFFKLQEANGAYEYSHPLIVALEDDVDPDTYLNAYARDFYGEPSSEEPGIYHFDEDSIDISVQSWTEITEQDYKTLNKYI